MRHGFFFGERHLRAGFADAFVDEDGVVSESAVAAGFGCDDAVPEPFGDDGGGVAWVLNEDGDGAIKRAAVGFVLQRGEKFLVVVVVACVVSRVSGGADAGGSAEDGNGDAGVVGDCGEPGKFGSVSGFGEGVFQKGAMRFRGGADSEFALGDEFGAQSGERGANLAQLAGVGGSEDDFHFGDYTRRGLTFPAPFRVIIPFSRHAPAKPMPRRFAKMKTSGEKIAALTAYDATFARVVAGRGADFILVGDSLGMVLRGHRDTLGVSLSDVRRCVSDVVAGAPDAFVVGDMPFGTFQRGPESAFANAAKLMAAGAAMVKMEGGEIIAPTVRFAADRGVPVCAHVGLTPQSARADGGFKVQGRGEQNAKRVRNDAVVMQEAGAAMIVLELIPAALAGDISKQLRIPTVGIGSGAECDGQILVLHDMLGLFPPKRFTRDFLADVVSQNKTVRGGRNDVDDVGGGVIGDAVSEYVRAVKAGEFPSADNAFS